MSDTVFRTKTEPVASVMLEPEMTKERVVIPGETKVEPPFSDYEQEKGKPFLVDHYELGQLWNRGDMYSEAFVPEVETINEYLKYAINKGDVANTTESVIRELNRIEKLINCRSDQKKSVRIGMVAEYVKFILKSENIKRDAAKYGMI